MPIYSPPLADFLFTLTRVIGLERIQALSGYESIDEDLLSTILGSAGQLAEEVFAPLNQTGDRTGAKIDGDQVTLPAGFRDAYRNFSEGGWNGLPVDGDLGGQELPWVVALAVQEMLQAANISLALCPLLNQGAIELCATHGDAMIRKRYLPKLVSGAWTGTMNLTEPQAGSDVGAVGCQARHDGDHYKITGQKIYISYGEHDMAENILHLVLARLPNAPEGTRGLSLFLVPKFLANEDGSLGSRNDLRVLSIEHKMGLHASPTCVMSFGEKDGATGYMVGSENGGMAAMFTMMNNARISVGVQGLGLMERATQAAIAYAKDRVQGHDLRYPKGPLVPIIRHPDVRRMLLTMKALTEAGRALVLDCGLMMDTAKRAANESERSAAQTRVDLLTPVIKAWLTDRANEVTSQAVQVFGGMGFIEETGVAQYMRDTRVLAIYEGTNGIQALDLVFRKLLRDKGLAFDALLGEIEVLAESLKQETGDDLAVIRQNLVKALAAVREAATFLLHQEKNPDVVAAGASYFLLMLGHTLSGYGLAKASLAAQHGLASRDGDPIFLAAKLVTAQFYAEHILPQTTALLEMIQNGGNVVVAADDIF